MLKKISVLFFSFVFSFSFVLTVGAENEPDIAMQQSNGISASTFVIDEADLLSDNEITELETKLENIFAQTNQKVYALTTESFGEKTAEEYADDMLDFLGGYNESSALDGCILVINATEGKWQASMSGYCITAITDYGLNIISEKFLPSLKSGNYYEAFCIFADSVNEFVVEARNNKPYDVDNKYDSGFNIKYLLIGLAIGLIVAFFVTNAQKSKLKTVVPKATAKDYYLEGSLQLSLSQDVFVNSNITRTAKAKSDNSSSSGGSSTHTSSSGNTHSSGGGSF